MTQEKPRESDGNKQRGVVKKQSHDVVFGSRFKANRLESRNDLQLRVT